MVFCAIVATVALDVQEETVEVTTYEYVTTTTSLFDYDQSPQYIEYDLAKNYTGYYTADSQPYWDGTGQKGSGYYTTSTVNRYILNLAPGDASSTTENMVSDSLAKEYEHTNIHFYGPDGIDSHSAMDMGNPVENFAINLGNILLSDFITQYSLTDYNKITLTPVDDAISHRLLFISTDDLFYDSPWYFQAYTYADTIDEYDQFAYGGVVRDTTVGPLSCVYNLTTGIVSVYSSPTPTPSTFIRDIPVAKLLIVYGGESAPAYTTFGSSIHIEAETLPATEYLDITKGVIISPTI